MISDYEEEFIELNKKLNTTNKHILKIIDALKNLNLDNKKPSAEEEKERVEKIFEKKGIGRPKGDFESKQKQYLDMLNKGKIKQPKEQTLEYYKITKTDDGKFELMD